MPPGTNLAVSQTLMKGESSVANVANAAGHALAFALVAGVSWLQQVPACAPAAILAVEFAPPLLTIPPVAKHLIREAVPGATWQSICRNPSKSVRALLSSDFGIYLSAFICPLFLGMITGSLVSIVLELAVATTRFAGPGLTYLGRVPGARPNLYQEIGTEDSQAKGIPHVTIVRLEGSRWFGNASATTRRARRERKNSAESVLASVVDMRMVGFFDETALDFYKREWINTSKELRLFATNCNARVLKQLRSSGLAVVFDQPEEAFLDMHVAVQLAEAYVLQSLAARPATTGDSTCSEVEAMRAI
jgi:hypothetical protein